MKTMKTLAQLENLDLVQDFIEQQLLAAGCPEPIRMQVAMAVEEIYVNIVDYAYFPETGDVEVQCSLMENPLQVTIEFRDKGQPFDPLEHPEADIHSSAEERDIGGLGIFMTRQLMDKVDYRYEHGKNILTLKKEWRKVT